MKIDLELKRKGYVIQYQLSMKFMVHEVFHGSVEMPLTITEAESSQESEIRSSK